MLTVPGFVVLFFSSWEQWLKGNGGWFEGFRWAGLIECHYFLLKGQNSCGCLENETPGWIKKRVRWIKSGPGKRNGNLSEVFSVHFCLKTEKAFKDMSVPFFRAGNTFGWKVRHQQVRLQRVFRQARLAGGGAPKSNSKQIVPIKKRAEPNTQGWKESSRTQHKEGAFGVCCYYFRVMGCVTVSWGGLVRTENILAPQSNGSHLSCRTFRSDDFPSKSCKVKSRVITPSYRS